MPLKLDETTQQALAWLKTGNADPVNGDPFTVSPVFASTYHLAGDPAQVRDRYGRTSNPAWANLERVLGALEGGDAVIFPSGMAAATACLMPFLRAGDQVLIPSDGYYTVRDLAENFLKPLGVSVVYYETANALETELTNVALIWVETPCNPGLDVCDLAALAERAKATGTLLVCDNTTMTPLLQRCLDFGADLVMSSDTKAINGHSDVLLGHVATRDAATLQRLQSWRTASGSIPGPMETWLVLRGLQTVELRLERMTANALAIAEMANKHKAVPNVRYPGLSGDPAQAIADRQMVSGGPLVTLTFETARTADTFLAALTIAYQATSFGGTHSLAERRARWDTSNHPGLVRFAAGCEPTSMLVGDVAQALDQLL